MSYKSNVAEFLKRYEQNKDSIHRQFEDVGTKNIKAETPVLSGQLRDGNKSTSKEDRVYFYNIEEYAPYVELGTYKQRANPFMRRGINKSRKDFMNILKRELKV